MYSGKKAQHDFPKMRGGGDQRPFGTFPKIHPFWKSRPSLKNQPQRDDKQFSEDVDLGYNLWRFGDKSKRVEIV